MHPSTCVAVLILASATAAQAAELVVKDLGFSIAALPSAFDYRIESPTLSRSGSDAFDSGTELALGGRYSFARPGDSIGLVLGADILTDTWTYGSDGVLGSASVRVSAGLGWAITDDWSLVVEPGARYGMTTLDLPGTSSRGDVSGSGSCSGYDAKLLVLWQLRPGLLVSAQAGWLDLSHEVSDGDIDLTLDQGGLMLGIGLAWRWSTAPPRIE